MPRLSRFALERRGALRACAGLHDRSVDESFGKRSSAQGGEIEVPWNASNDRGRSGSRNSAAIKFHGTSWTRLSRARTLGEEVERWRVEWNTVGCAARLEPARCPLRAR